MSNVKNKDTMAYKNKMKYTGEYNAKNCKRVYISFNTKTEQDLLNYLLGKRKATFVKMLLREAKEAGR